MRMLSVTRPPEALFFPFSLQVSIVNGQIVVDQATLTVQAQPEDRQRTIVEDTQRLNSKSYAVNRNTSERWQEQETENFYRASLLFARLHGRKQWFVPSICFMKACLWACMRPTCPHFSTAQTAVSCILFTTQNR